MMISFGSSNGVGVGVGFTATGDGVGVAVDIFWADAVSVKAFAQKTPAAAKIRPIRASLFSS